MSKTKKVTKKVASEKKEEKKVYSLVISMNGDEQKIDGDTVAEAFEALTVPPVFKTETIIKVTKGEITKEKILNVSETRRVFNNDTSMELLTIGLTKMLP